MEDVETDEKEPPTKYPIKAKPNFTPLLLACVIAVIFLIAFFLLSLPPKEQPPSYIEPFSQENNDLEVENPTATIIEKGLTGYYCESAPADLNTNNGTVNVISLLFAFGKEETQNQLTNAYVFQYALETSSKSIIDAKIDVNQTIGLPSGCVKLGGI